MEIRFPLSISGGSITSARHGAFGPRWLTGSAAMLPACILSSIRPGPQRWNGGQKVSGLNGINPGPFESRMIASTEEGISAGVTGRDRSAAKSPMKGDGAPDEGCRAYGFCLPPTTRPLSTRHRCRNDCRPITSAKAPHGRENSCRNLQAPSVGQDRGCSPFHAELRRDRLRAVPGAKCFFTCRQHVKLRRSTVCSPERGARISLSPPGTFFSLDFDRC